MAASKDRMAPRMGEIEFVNSGPVNGGAHLYAGTFVSRDAQGNLIASTSTSNPPCGAPTTPRKSTGRKVVPMPSMATTSNAADSRYSS